jgi:DNA topoisomerase VI subunit A
MTEIEGHGCYEFIAIRRKVHKFFKMRHMTPLAIEHLQRHWLTSLRPLYYINQQLRVLQSVQCGVSIEICLNEFLRS